MFERDGTDVMQPENSEVWHEIQGNYVNRGGLLCQGWPNQELDWVHQQIMNQSSTIKTINCDSILVCHHNLPKLPHILSIHHDNGFIDDISKNGNQMYFSEHDGSSIMPVLELMREAEIFPSPCEIKTNDGRFTGKDNTSESIWIEYHDIDALQKLDGYQQLFSVKETYRKTDGEWIPERCVWEIKNPSGKTFQWSR